MFKIGPSLGLSRLMSTMFKNIPNLINFRVINTTCFGNTIFLFKFPVFFWFFFHWKAIYENAYKAIKVSIKIQRIIGTYSGMSILYYPALKEDISLYNPIILWEINYFIILRFKISRFPLYLWSPRYFQMCFINRLSKLSFITFRVYLQFEFELA